MTILMRKIWN